MADMALRTEAGRAGSGLLPGTTATAVKDSLKKVTATLAARSPSTSERFALRYAAQPSQRTPRTANRSSLLPPKNSSARSDLLYFFLLYVLLGGRAAGNTAAAGCVEGDKFRGDHQDAGGQHRDPAEAPAPEPQQRERHKHGPPRPQPREAQARRAHQIAQRHLQDAAR
jgi:hypothetical protein